MRCLKMYLSNIVFGGLCLQFDFDKYINEERAVNSTWVFTKEYKIFPTKSVGNKIEIINSKLIQASKLNAKVNSLTDLQLNCIRNGNNNFRLLEML